MVIDMFGYVTVNKPELKFKEFDMYQAYYCGLCRVLREKYGLNKIAARWPAKAVTQFFFF